MKSSTAPSRAGPVVFPLYRWCPPKETPQPQPPPDAGKQTLKFTSRLVKLTSRATHKTADDNKCIWYVCNEPHAMLWFICNFVTVDCYYHNAAKLYQTTRIRNSLWGQRIGCFASIHADQPITFCPTWESYFHGLLFPSFAFICGISWWNTILHICWICHRNFVVEGG